MKLGMRLVCALALMSAVGILAVTGITQSQTLSGSALVTALRQGGYVIVMRHTSSPRETPSKQAANPDNVNLERQLDKAGQTAQYRWAKLSAI